MSENQETQTQPSELEELQARAKQLGIKYRKDTPVETLRERVNDVLNGNDSQSDEGLEEGDESMSAVETDEEPESETPNQRRLRKQREASELVRVQVTCMNPNKREHDGEVLCAGNSTVGTFKKFVPFDVPWHVPRMIYKVLKDRECQVFVTERDDRGRQIRKGKQIKEYNVAELEPLSKEELDDLAQRQAMANGSAAA